MLLLHLKVQIFCLEIEGPLEKEGGLSDFMQAMKNGLSISLSDNSHLQMCCTGFLSLSEEVEG